MKMYKQFLDEFFSPPFLVYIKQEEWTWNLNLNSSLRHAPVLTHETSWTKRGPAVCVCVRRLHVPLMPASRKTPILWCVNESTCSGRGFGVAGSLVYQCLADCMAFCFTTWIIRVVWNQFNNRSWEWFEYVNVARGWKQGKAGWEREMQKWQRASITALKSRIL